ncbi:MAG: hypothetical protein EHM47_13585 [Ignavibacteriales bacterium]|nr:MAG: hypothetical protein EHM47_13585 [Ignavibacteriales bacterium]
MSLLIKIENLKVRPEGMDTEEYVSALLPVLKGFLNEPGIDESFESLISNCYYDLTIHLEDIEKVKKDLDSGDQTIQNKFNNLRKFVLKRIDDFIKDFFSSTGYKRLNDQKKFSRDSDARPSSFQVLNNNIEQKAGPPVTSFRVRDDKTSDVTYEASLISNQLLDLLERIKELGIIKSKRDSIIDLAAVIDQQINSLKKASAAARSTGHSDDKEEEQKIEYYLRRNMIEGKAILNEFNKSYQIDRTLEEKAVVSGAHHSKKEEAASDIDIFDLAKKLDRPHYSPSKRKQLLADLVEFVNGRPANLGVQRAM